MAQFASYNAAASAAAALNAATEAETDAGTARAAADEADTYADYAVGAAAEADTDATAAETAATHAQDHAEAANEAAERAEAEERRRLEEQRRQLAATQPDPVTGSTGFGGTNLGLTDEELLRADCGQACVDEFNAALAQANKDVVDWLIENGGEMLISVIVDPDDIRRCLGEGNVSSCLWALFDLATLLAAPVKVFKGVKKGIEVASGVRKHWNAIEKAKQIVDKYRDR